MHRCLLLPEIQRLVIASIPSVDAAPDPFAGSWQRVPEGDRKAYAALARTCGAFYEPAMNALWRNIGSLSPVLDGLLEEHTAAANANKTGLQKIHASLRFLNNARRVRAVHLWDAPKTARHLQALKLRYPFVEPLFPNLQCLTLGSISPGLGLFLPWFIGPALIALHANGWVDLDVLINTLSRATQVCPKLQELYHNDKEVPDYVSTVLSAFSHLERFRCGHGLTGDALLQISRLPLLRTLEFGAVPVDAIRALRSRSFASLVALKISPERGEFEPTLKVVRSVTSTCLTHITLDITAATTEWMDTACIQSIVQTVCIHSCLTDVSISAHPEIMLEGEPVPISALFSLRRLESLDIRFPGLSVADADVPSIAAAWPNLHTFRMLTGQYDTLLSTSEFTPAALALFARHIPHLRALAIDMDTSRLHELELPRDRSSAPITLTLDHLRLEDRHVLPMAAYIATVYPEAVIDTALIDELMQDDLVMAARGQEVADPVPDFWSRIGCEYLPVLKRFRNHSVAMALEAADTPH